MDKITVGQVVRAIEAAKTRDAQGVNAALGAEWYKDPRIPSDVLAGWRETSYTPLRRALTRWRDELAAAEPVRRVARWDARRGAYVALDDHGAVCMITPDRETAIGWGYEPEGGPEPVQQTPMERARAKLVAMSPEAAQRLWGDLCAVADDHEMAGPEPIQPAEDSPERLRERREVLGNGDAWIERILGDMSLPGYGPAADDDLVSRRQRREAAEGVDHHDYGTACEANLRAVYAAALSAEEALRAEEERLACAYRESDGTLVWDDSPLPEPERPAPRFKVGDWVQRPGSPPFRVRSMFEDSRGFAYCAAGHDMGVVESALVAAEAPALPASPPAPEVVDVPQPIVKRLRSAEAQWYRGETVMRIEVDESGYVYAPLALLRAMLEAIDAQQGAPAPAEDDHPWRVVGEQTAFALPFGTIRECSGCGCLVSGGPTACRRCADAQQGGAS